MPLPQARRYQNPAKPQMPRRFFSRRPKAPREFQLFRDDDFVMFTPRVDAIIEDILVVLCLVGAFYVFFQVIVAVGLFLVGHE